MGQHREIKEKITDIKNRVTDLGGTVLGEGIEGVDQFRNLKETGVEYGQGYYFARPEPAGNIINKL